MLNSPPTKASGPGPSRRCRDPQHRLRRTALPQTHWEFLRFPNTGSHDFKVWKHSRVSDSPVRAPKDINHGCRGGWSTGRWGEGHHVADPAEAENLPNTGQHLQQNQWMIGVCCHSYIEFCFIPELEHTVPPHLFRLLDLCVTLQVCPVYPEGTLGGSLDHLNPSIPSRYIVHLWPTLLC